MRVRVYGLGFRARVRVRVYGLGFRARVRVRFRVQGLGLECLLGCRVQGLGLECVSGRFSGLMVCSGTLGTVGCLFGNPFGPLPRRPCSRRLQYATVTALLKVVKGYDSLVRLF